MPEKGKEVPNRRRLLRNIVAVGAAGLAGLLLQGDANLVQPVKATCVTGCVHYKDSAKTVEVVSGTATYAGCCAVQSGVLGQACGKPSSPFDVIGVYGCAPNGIGVYGRSSGCGAIVAQPGGNAPGLWVFSESRSSVGIQVCAYTCQSVPIQKWNSSDLTPCSISSVVDQKGRFGIGTTSPGAPLDVVGADTTPQTAGIRVSTPTYPQLLLNVSGGGSNEKIWRLIGRNLNPSNAFQIETLDDTYANEVAAMQITRSGTSISNVCFPNGYVGIGTTTPVSALDIENVVLTGSSPTTAMQVNETIQNSTAETSTIYHLFFPTLTDASSANRLSAQLLRFVYQRNAGTAGLPTAYDSLINTTPVINENMNAALRGLTLEGPIVASGKTLGQYYGLFIGAPTGAGTISTNYALLTQPGSGNVGIGTINPAYTLDVAGPVHATSFPTSSDMRFKEEIQPIDHALDKVLALNGVYFKWNHLHRDVLKRDNTKERQVGLVAQQVKEVIPELVSEWADEGADDYLAVDYSRLSALTIEAIKQLNDKLQAENNTLRDTLEAENKSLRERIEQQQQRIEVLERKLAAS